MPIVFNEVTKSPASLTSLKPAIADARALPWYETCLRPEPGGFPTVLAEQRSVLILHRDQAIVDALISLFNGQTMSVAGATTSAKGTALQNLLKPQLVISSLHNDWLPVLKRLRNENPGVEIIGLTDSDLAAQNGRDIGIENIVITDADPESSAEEVQLCIGPWLGKPSESEDIKILLVDNDIKALAKLSNQISRWGYSALTARNGRRALGVLEKDPSITVVVLNFMLPEMGGLETLKEVKTAHEAVNVIMVSEVADREIVQRALHLGAVDLLLKPLDMNMLETSIMACAARSAFRKRSWWKRLMRSRM
jgi:DNA-binding response OmpR family regulator